MKKNALIGVKLLSKYPSSPFRHFDVKILVHSFSKLGNVVFSLNT